MRVCFVTTLLAWLIIGTLGLAAFTFFILTPLAWVVRGLASLAENRQNRRVQTPGVPSKVITLANGTHVLEPNLHDPVPSEPMFNDNGVDISFGVWGSTIIPYTKQLAQLMGQFGPMIKSGDEGGICTVAMRIVAELDQMESVIPPPPNAEAAAQWAAMILLLRRTCQSAVHGVEVTRNLDTASVLLGMASDEMGEMARTMNDWTDKFASGELA